MKKLIDALKTKKNLLIVLVLLIALILIVIIINGNGKTTFTNSASPVAKTDEEIKLERILSGIKGVGQAEVMISNGKDGIEGVVVVCSGANNIMTKNDILNAVSTALKVEKNNIAIYAMN